KKKILNIHIRNTVTASEFRTHSNASEEHRAGGVAWLPGARSRVQVSPPLLIQNRSPPSLFYVYFCFHRIFVCCLSLLPDKKYNVVFDEWFPCVTRKQAYIRMCKTRKQSLCELLRKRSRERQRLQAQRGRGRGWRDQARAWAAGGPFCLARERLFLPSPTCAPPASSAPQGSGAPVVLPGGPPRDLPPRAALAKPGSLWGALRAAARGLKANGPRRSSRSGTAPHPGGSSRSGAVTGPGGGWRSGAVNGPRGGWRSGVVNGPRGESRSGAVNGPRGGCRSGVVNGPGGGWRSGAVNGPRGGWRSGVVNGPRGGSRLGVVNGPRGGWRSGVVNGPRGGSRSGAVNGPRGGSRLGVVNGPRGGWRSGVVNGPRGGSRSGAVNGPGGGWRSGAVNGPRGDSRSGAVNGPPYAAVSFQVQVNSEGAPVLTGAGRGGEGGGTVSLHPRAPPRPPARSVSASRPGSPAGRRAASAAAAPLGGSGPRVWAQPAAVSRAAASARGGQKYRPCKTRGDRNLLICFKL
uniref:Uncharacterized protein n=1 Tax=Apteryx owenii TaxID=8824 RepID=A0A8B9S2D1_APTOW